MDIAFLVTANSSTSVLALTVEPYVQNVERSGASTWGLETLKSSCSKFIIALLAQDFVRLN